MSRSLIEVGDKLQCIELNTKHPGLLIVEQDKVWVEFVGFGSEPTIDADQPIVLHTTKGFVVTLSDNVDISPQLPSWRRGDVATVHKQRIVSNYPIYGETAWSSDDLVSAVYFEVTPDCPFLWARDRASTVASTPTESTPDRDIVAVETALGQVRLGFVCEGDQYTDRWRVTAPYFGIHFSNGVMLKDALSRVSHLTSLFTLLSWQNIEASEIAFARQGDDPRMYPFRLLDAVATKQEAATPRLSLVPLSVDSDEQRASFADVVSQWMALEPKWADAVHLMRQSQRTFQRYSMERAMDACRWHEALQRADGPEVVPHRMQEVTNAAKAKAVECGLSDYVGMVVSRLSGIRGEPRRKLFARIVDKLNGTFGTELFRLPLVIDMLMGAYDARNLTGHGASRSLSSLEVRNLMGDTLAMEALCLARMTAELPMSDRGHQLLTNHPLLSGFRSMQRERISLPVM